MFDSRSLNVAIDFKLCLRRLYKESGLSAEGYVDRLNEIAGRFGISLMKGRGKGDVTVATFEKWINPKEPAYHPPLTALTVICQASESIEPLQIFAAALGVEVIDEKRRKRLQWADAFIEEREARKRKNKLEALL